MEDGVARNGRGLLVMLALGVLYALAVIWFGLVYVNVPAGFNTAYGLHFPSVELFSSVWSYPKLSFSSGQFTLAAASAVALMWLVYFVAVAAAGSGTDQRRIGLIIAVAALVNFAVAVAMPPVLSGDVYHYALQGRMFALRGINPYAATGTAAADDPFFYFAVWRNVISQYGPTWELIAAALAWLGQPSVLVTVMLFKLAPATAHVVGAVVVAALARRFDAANCTRVTLLYAWNPVLLLEGAAAGHNDAVMIALALAAIWFFCRDQLVAGGALFAASVLVKYVTGILLVFALLVLIRRDGQRWAKSMTRLALAGGLTALLLYLPFLFSLQHPLQLFAGMAPSLNPMPNNIGDALRAALAGLLGNGIRAEDPSVTAVLNGSFVVFLLWQSWGVWRSSAPWQAALARFAAADLVYAYVLFGGSFPWYLVPAIATGVLAAPGRPRFYLVAVTTGLALGFMLQNVKLIAT